MTRRDQTLLPSQSSSTARRSGTPWAWYNIHVQAHRDGRHRPRQAWRHLRYLLDISLHLGKLHSICSRAEHCGLLIRITDFIGFDRLTNKARKVLQLIFLDQHPPRSDAGLTTVCEACTNSSLRRLPQISVWKNDICGFASQLQRHTLDGVCGFFLNFHAGPVRPGERNHVDVWMTGQYRSDAVAVAMDHVEDTFGTPASSRTSANNVAFKGARSLGLSTIVQPAASAGVTLAGDLIQGPFREKSARKPRLAPARITCFPCGCSN